MKRSTRLAVYGISIAVLCPVLGSAPVVSQGTDYVDFRMAPLEQVKKIAGQLRDRAGAGVTMTIMNAPTGRIQDRRHLIVNETAATSGNIQRQLQSGNFDSLTWSSLAVGAYGTCDSDKDCERKTDEMCKNAGHKGVKPSTAKVTIHLDGSKTCAGDCKANGAIAFVTCDPTVP